MGKDAADDFAVIRIAGDNGGGTVARRDGFLADIKAQFSSSVFRVRAVAGETVF
jgi:hypothetical protein